MAKMTRNPTRRAPHPHPPHGLAGLAQGSHGSGHGGGQAGGHGGGHAGGHGGGQAGSGQCGTDFVSI